MQEQKKEYNHEAYKEERKKHDKKYREAHKEERNEYKKKYYEQNKAEITSKKSEKVTCEVCNAVVIKSDIARHRKSKKHLAALNALNPDINTNQ